MCSLVRNFREFLSFGNLHITIICIRCKLDEFEGEHWWLTSPLVAHNSFRILAWSERPLHFVPFSHFPSQTNAMSAFILLCCHRVLRTHFIGRLYPVRMTKPLIAYRLFCLNTNAKWWMKDKLMTITFCSLKINVSPAKTTYRMLGNAMCQDQTTVTIANSFHV